MNRPGATYPLKMSAENGSGSPGTDVPKPNPIGDGASISMNIYVGNIAYELSEDELREAFSSYGEVESARIITDRFTGRSKGFGFVEMADDEQAQKAIDEMNGRELSGRALRVNEARPRPAGDRPRGGDFGGGRGGYDRY